MGNIASMLSFGTEELEGMSKKTLLKRRFLFLMGLGIMETFRWATVIIFYVSIGYLRTLEAICTNEFMWTELIMQIISSMFLYLMFMNLIKKNGGFLLANVILFSIFVALGTVYSGIHTIWGGIEAGKYNNPPEFIGPCYNINSTLPSNSTVFPNQNHYNMNIAYLVFSGICAVAGVFEVIFVWFTYWNLLKIQGVMDTNKSLIQEGIDKVNAGKLGGLMDKRYWYYALIMALIAAQCVFIVIFYVSTSFSSGLFSITVNKYHWLYLGLLALVILIWIFKFAVIERMELAAQGTEEEDDTRHTIVPQMLTFILMGIFGLQLAWVCIYVIWGAIDTYKHRNPIPSPMGEPFENRHAYGLMISLLIMYAVHIFVLPAALVLLFWSTDIRKKIMGGLSGLWSKNVIEEEEEEINELDLL
jgi:hypothetical protein